MPSCRASPVPGWPAMPASCGWAGWAGARCWCSAAGAMPTKTASADGMKGALRTLRALGIEMLVQTNAAGSLDPAMPAGSLMLISDHLNLPQRSPLVGEGGSERFVDMVNAYDPALRERRTRRGGAPRHHAARRRLRLDAGPAVRDPGRDPHAAHAGRARGGHEHRAGDDPRALAGAARAGAVAGHQPGGRAVGRAVEPCAHAGPGAGRQRGCRRCC